MKLHEVQELATKYHIELTNPTTGKPKPRAGLMMALQNIKEVGQLAAEQMEDYAAMETEKVAPARFLAVPQEAPPPLDLLQKVRAM